MPRNHRPGPPPRVSVIVPARDAMPGITRAVTSAMEQTLGLSRLDIIAVDDGSADGTAEELDRLAADCPSLHVVRDPHPCRGGAGGPRNTGLARATGDFVFFLDADARLAPDALRRMVAMADQNGTDVVLGKMVSPDGRGVPKAVFRHNQLRTDVHSSHAYASLEPCKLFRRSLIERLRLRFPAHLRHGEGKPFTAAAYLNASGISVVADYDCYHLGPNPGRTAPGLAERVEAMRPLFETAARHTRTGTRRDAVMRHHIRRELCPALRALPREDETEVRERFLPELRRWALAHCSDALFQTLTAPERLMVHLLRTGRFEDLLSVVRNAKRDARCGHLVEKGSVYWLHPFFRDPDAEVPDACFDVTDRLPVRHHLAGAGWHGRSTLRVRGRAAIDGLAADPEEDRAELVLRRREARDEVRIPVDATAEDPARFEADVDIATADGGTPLRPGVWDVFLDVRAQGISRTVRFGGRHDDLLDIGTARRVVAAGPGLRARVTPYFTSPYRNLSLDIGPAPRGAPCEVTEAVWHPADKGTLVVAGRLLPPGTPARGRVLRLRAEHTDGRVHDHPVRFAAGIRRAPSPPGCRCGTWARPVDGDAGRRRPGDDGQGPARRARRGRAAARPAARRPLGAARRPYYAKPLMGRGEVTLELRVAPVRLLAAVRNRLGLN
ncbi:glycosyltransferase [Streptomyces rapamycinicus]|uniref:glycosyltransferase n=1 Tax=Streptomyces rapamycinicus TaxID=1226757 RepID=UPI0032D9AD66